MTDYKVKPKEEPAAPVGRTNADKRISLAFGESDEPSSRKKDHDEGFSIRKIRTVTEEADLEKGKSYINEKGQKMVPLSEEFKKEQIKKSKR